MPVTPSGADELANTLLASLIAGKDFTIPDIDISDDLFLQPDEEGFLYKDIVPIATNDLTIGTVDGTGVFDRLMTSLVNHLKVEYTANRISGAEYTKAYIGIVGAALQTSSQFLLGKDQAYWAAVLAQAQVQQAQIQAIQARIELETARVMFCTRAKYEAANAEAQYGLTKMQIANADLAYTATLAQIALTEAQAAGVIYTNANLLPKQVESATSQIAVQEAQKTGITLTNTTIIPKQAGLLAEQIEVQRAQTLDTRSDTATITGAIGKQKLLYQQQIDSYKRDAETKAVRLWTDAYISSLTLLEGTITPPGQFSDANLNTILTTLRTNLSL